MRKSLTLAALLFISNLALAQNDAVLATPLGAIISPSSGCVLTSAEQVTIRVFNSGPGTINSPFYLSYDITGPVASYAGETVPVGTSIPPNSSFVYTFTTLANLSLPGTYTMSDTVLVTGDPNAGNNTQSGYTITLTPSSDGGTILGPSSVCTGDPTVNFLTLSGNVGNVVSWGYSTDGGSVWNTISNTSTVQNYSNLTIPTKYRALVQNGACPSAYSDTLSIAIDVLSAGGTLAPANRTVCSGSSSGLMTLGPRTGSIVKWQYSIDNWATPIDTAITIATFTYPSVTSNPTRFRVVVKNGACPSVNSTVSTITVTPPSVAGTVSGGATVCSGSNTGSLTLTGYTGAIQWQFSANRTFTPPTNAGTTATQAYTNLTATRYYRARVTSTGCSSVFSNIDSIVVNPAAVGGTLSSAATVCSGSTSGLLTLAGYTGTVSSWEVSVNGGAYTTIANTLPTYTSGALASGVGVNRTYDYRVRVMNGTCGPALSSVIRITVNPPSAGGTTASNDTVCSGANGATINLSGHLGTIQNWQSSTDGVLWTNIANTTTAQTYSNLTATTYYTAVVKNGVCASDTSTIDTIIVSLPSVGGVIASSANVCFGNNYDTLTLSGHIGNVLGWEYSIDGGINWISIANTTTSYIYTNITVTTQYRAIVQNGTCPAAYSSVATLTVDPVSAGGTLNGSATACGGSNSGTLTLINYIGTIQNWESSTNGGFSWTPIANTTATENYLNVATTTQYRVIVKSGACSNDTSSIATIIVDPATVGGTVSMSDTVCAGANNGTLTLSGFTGNIQHWESSTDGGTTWLTLSNTSATQNYSNLMVTTMYRAYVKSGVCNGDTSISATITIDPTVVAGTISGSTTVCSGSNSGTLSLTGYTGTIVDWESSLDGIVWTSLVNAVPTQTYTNILDTTYYRAIVTSGVCGNDTSSTTTIFVDPVTVGGTISVSDTVCTGSNSGTLTLSGYTGTIQRWDFSTDGGASWLTLSNTTATQNYSNLMITTMYRAYVKSGVCNGDTSISATITVEPLPVGGSISGSTTVCEGSNNGTLTLSGYVGTIMDWESSIDSGATWVSLAKLTTNHMYNNLVDTTWYRVIVTTSNCGNDTSSYATINMYPKPQASFTADTVCFGNATTFTNTSTLTSGFIQFNQWDFGDNNSSTSKNPVYAYATADTFSVSLFITSNVGCMDTATVNVIVNPLPSDTITASGPLEFCAGDSVILSAAIGTYDYMWSTADTMPNITVKTSGTFALIITDTITGCSASNMETVKVSPVPTVFAGNDTTLSLGSSINLNATGIGVVSWSWSPSTGLDGVSTPNPVANPVLTTTYKVIGTDINGCSDEDSLTITVLIDFNVTISNLMTPNNDGYNDKWIVQNIENYPNTTVIVVNREGQQIFKSDSYDNSWDGTNTSGKSLPDGTYYYIVKFQDSDKLYKGAITILKQK